MNAPQKIPPDDPRLTAYALGELEGDELALVDAFVRADPVLQAAVAELRAFGQQLASALAAEPASAATAPDSQPAQVDASPATDADTDVASRPPRPRRAPCIPFPLFVYGLATAAAACLAVVLWLKVDAFMPKPKAVALAPTAKDTGQIGTNWIAGNVPPAPAATMTAVQAAPAGAFVNVSSASKFAAADGESGASPMPLDAVLAQPRAQRVMSVGGLVANGKTAHAVLAAAIAETVAGASSRRVPLGAARNIHSAGGYLPFAYEAEAFSTSILLAGTTSSDAARTPETVNALSFACLTPTSGDAPFASHLEIESADLNEPPPLPLTPPAEK